jgi:Flp pilus assembly protein TadG
LELRLFQFAKDIRALGALEFALMVPVMLILWTGTVELAQFHLASRKVTIAAQSAADLISQEVTLTEAKLNDIVQAVTAIMDPFPVEGLGITFVSVEADSDGRVTIGWRFDGGVAAASEGTIPPRAIPLVGQNDSVIVAVMTYRHRGTFKIFSDASAIDTVITEEAFIRPRRVEKIPLN